MSLNRFLLKISLLMASIFCSKHIFANVAVKGFPKALEFEPLYSNADYSGKFKASISYDVKYKGLKGTKVHLVIGKRDDISEGLTCVGKNLIQLIPKSSGNLVIESAEIEEEETSINGIFYIKDSGLYAFFQAVCPSEMDLLNGEEIVEKVESTGYVNFLNPFGYLPAHRYPLYYIYIGMTIFYFCCVAYWYHICHKYRFNLLSYHHGITLILIISVVESFFQMIDTIDYNNNGYRIHVIHVFAKILLTLRKTLCRIMIILICSGIVLIKKEMSPSFNRKLSATMICYFLANIFFEFQKDFHIKGEIQYSYVFLSICISGIDIFTVIWAFLALLDTFWEIDEREKYRKKLYKQFSLMMILGGVMVFAFSILQAKYVQNKSWLTINGWKVFWIYEFGFWELMFIYFTFSIFYLISPSVNITEYQQIDIETGKRGEENPADLYISSDLSSKTDEVEEAERTIRQIRGENKDAKIEETSNIEVNGKNLDEKIDERDQKSSNDTINGEKIDQNLDKNPSNNFIVDEENEQKEIDKKLDEKIDENDKNPSNNFIVDKENKQKEIDKNLNKKIDENDKNPSNNSIVDEENEQKEIDKKLDEKTDVGEENGQITKKEENEIEKK